MPAPAASRDQAPAALSRDRRSGWRSRRAARRRGSARSDRTRRGRSRGCASVGRVDGQQHALALAVEIRLEHLEGIGTKFQVPAQLRLSASRTAGLRRRDRARIRTPDGTPSVGVRRQRPGSSMCAIDAHRARSRPLRAACCIHAGSSATNSRTSAAPRRRTQVDRGLHEHRRQGLPTRRRGRARGAPARSVGAGSARTAATPTTPLVLDQDAQVGRPGVDRPAAARPASRDRRRDRGLPDRLDRLGLGAGRRRAGCSPGLARGARSAPRLRPSMISSGSAISSIWMPSGSLK